MSEVQEVKGAMLQRNDTYGIKLRTPLGVVLIEDMEKIISVAKELNIKTLKLTGGQRIILSGLTAEQVEPTKAKLGAFAVTPPHMQACSETCKFRILDGYKLATILEQAIVDRAPLPAKTKFGVSSCPHSCAQGLVRDFGLVGKKNGWSLYMGGNSASKPEIGRAHV